MAKESSVFQLPRFDVSILALFRLGLEVQPGQIIIRPVKHAREGWEQQFRLMAERGDDRLLDGDRATLSKWDEEEWEW